MTKQVLYTYLGTNGTITTPVHIEDAYYIRKNILIADKGKMLSKDGVKFYPSVTVPDDDVENWKEFDAPIGQD